jgi:hypothetical protein
MGDEEVGALLDPADLRLDLADLCLCLPTDMAPWERKGVEHAWIRPPPWCVPLHYLHVTAPHRTGEGGEGANGEEGEGVASEREERESPVRGEGAYVGTERGGGVGLGDERVSGTRRGQARLGVGEA